MCTLYRGAHPSAVWRYWAHTHTHTNTHTHTHTPLTHTSFSLSHSLTHILSIALSTRIPQHTKATEADVVSAGSPSKGSVKATTPREASAKSTSSKDSGHSSGAESVGQPTEAKETTETNVSVSSVVERRSVDSWHTMTLVSWFNYALQEHALRHAH